MNLRQLFGKHRVCDMAISRREYANKCFFMTDQLFVNMAKICTFDNHGLQKHWGKEMANALKPVMSVEVKNDNKAQELKRAVMIGNVIIAPLGDNYEEYDYDSLKNDYYEAITSEGYSIDSFDIKTIVNRNRQCYINYFEKLKKINFSDYKNELWSMSNDFINDVRAAYANE